MLGRLKTKSKRMQKELKMMVEARQCPDETISPNLYTRLRILNLLLAYPSRNSVNLTSIRTPRFSYTSTNELVPSPD